MFVLSRRIGEEIVITGGVRLRIISTEGDQVRLGVIVPPTVRVDCQEVGVRQEVRVRREVEPPPGRKSAAP